MKAIGADESWGALAAWTLTFVAMLTHLVQTLDLATPSEHNATP